MKTIGNSTVVKNVFQLTVLAACLISSGAAFAQTQSYKQLAAEWWQWVLSIPESQNPLTDTTGANCMVGQRGANWFLAGTFFGGSATRTCTVPAGMSLFFPVINVVSMDTPNACGQDSTPLPSSFYRGINAEFINGATNVSVTLDGQPITDLHHEQSQVFEVAVPQDNVFATPCAAVGGLPAGIYSPAVDEGIYVRLNPLTIGSHTLHFHAESSVASYDEDVTYYLTVVPIVTK